MNATNHVRWLWLSGLVIVLDQASKYWAEFILRDGVIPIFSWFDLTLVHNPGAAFGFLANSGGWQHALFLILACGVSVVLVFMLRALEPQQRHLAIAYALIIAGALGNAIDRVIYQYVVDFIHWFYQDWHFPHFNIADSSIFIGAALLISEAFNQPFLDRKTQDENITR